MKNLIFIILSAISFSVHAVATKYEIVLQEMKSVHEQYRSHTELFELASDAGQTILGIKIGTGPVKDLVLATHHGNEYGSTAVAVALIKDLAKNPISGRTTFIIPVINISGYNARQRAERGFDPNRDWAGPCGNAHGTPFRLTSISSVAKLMEEHPFVVGITLHTFANTVTYPWSFEDNSPTEHDAEFNDLAQFAASINGYRTGKTPDLIYTTRGDFESYAFWKHGMWSFLFEMGTSHSPSETQLEKLRRDNVPAIRNLLTQGPVAKAMSHEWNGNCANVLKNSLWFDRGDE